MEIISRRTISLTRIILITNRMVKIIIINTIITFRRKIIITLNKLNLELFYELIGYIVSSYCLM